MQRILAHEALVLVATTVVRGDFLREGASRRLISLELFTQDTRLRLRRIQVWRRLHFVRHVLLLRLSLIIGRRLLLLSSLMEAAIRVILRSEAPIIRLSLSSSTPTTAIPSATATATATAIAASIATCVVAVVPSGLIAGIRVRIVAVSSSSIATTVRIVLTRAIAISSLNTD